MLQLSEEVVNHTRVLFVLLLVVWGDDLSAWTDGRPVWNVQPPHSQRREQRWWRCQQLMGWWHCLAHVQRSGYILIEEPPSSSWEEAIQRREDIYRSHERATFRGRILDWLIPDEDDTGSLYSRLNSMIFERILCQEVLCRHSWHIEPLGYVQW